MKSQENLEESPPTIGDDKTIVKEQQPPAPVFESQQQLDQHQVVDDTKYNSDDATIMKEFGTASSPLEDYKINLKWMNPELILSRPSSSTSSSSSSLQVPPLPEYVRIAHDSIQNYTIQQLQDSIWEEIRHKINKNSENYSHTTSSSTFTMNFIYKGNILNPTTTSLIGKMAKVNTSPHHPPSHDPNTVLLCNVIPSLTTNVVETTSSTTAAQRDALTSSRASRNKNTITLFVVLIHDKSRQNSNNSDFNRNGKRSSTNPATATTDPITAPELSSSSSTSPSTAVVTSPTSTTPGTTNTATTATQQNILGEEEESSSSSSSLDMEQMIQQMLLRNSGSNGRNALMDQLQSQFPDHNIRDMLSQLGSLNSSSNPMYMQQQMERSLELQLSQLDHIPGGMNIVQNAYEQQMEQWDSIMNSTEASSNDNNNNSVDSSSNAFLMNLMNQMTGNTGNNTNNGNNNSSLDGNHTDIAGPSGRAIVNPWGTTSSRNSTNSRQRRRTTTTNIQQQEQILSSLFSSLRHRPYNDTGNNSSDQNSTRTTSTITNQYLSSSSTNPWLQEEHNENVAVAPSEQQQLQLQEQEQTSSMDDESQQHQQLGEQEQLLFDMGFTNRQQNRIVLQQNQYHFDRTVEMLLLLQSSDESTGGSNGNSNHNSSNSNNNEPSTKD